VVNFSMAYASRTAQTLKRGGYVTGILRFGCTWSFCAPLFDACKTDLSE